MAAIKKPIKKKDGNPSTILIIFLVFFILLSIGLGVAAYYGYEGQNKLREEAIAAKATAKAGKSLDNYRMGVIYFLANALGQELDQDVKVGAMSALDDIQKEGGPYKDEKDRKVFVDLLAELKKDLAFDEAGKKFQENYRARNKALQDDVKNKDTQLGKFRKDLKDEQDRYTSYQSKIDTFYKTALDDIAKGNNKTHQEMLNKFKYFDSLLKQNQEIQTAKLELETQLKTAQEQISIEKARVEKILEEKKNATLEVVSPKKTNEQQHGLLIDMSRGIPLWDRPVGKVTRVDIDRRQAFINLGSSHGVRPELTFNVFADDGKGNADKFLKATLEVIQVIDAQRSLCRITSLYDSAGAEIALNDPTKGRAAREVETAIRDGDLLFNMFWNSRIAVAGIINFTGFPVDAPAEQMRQLENFGRMLERMNIHLDAYLDLTDGQPKNSLSNKTRFLVIGDTPYVKDSKDQAQVDRAKLISDGIAAMKKDAIEKGIFLISAENFTIAAGYRKMRNGVGNDLAEFRPTIPFAGTQGGGLVIQRDRPVEAMPAEEKKAEEKKEEKKEPEAKEKN